MLFWPYLERLQLKFSAPEKFGEIGALPTGEFGKIGASVGEVGASAKNHSERLEHYIFGKMGALDSERLEYPLVYAYA